MTASAAERTRALLAAALLATGLGCAATPTPGGRALDPLPGRAAYVPDDVDLALRDLGEALMGGDAAAADETLERLAAIDAGREAPSGALPRALDARTSLLPDPIARRRRTEALLERDDIPKDLRSRLEQEVLDDPLRLAAERIGDARTRRFGRAFNALSEAVGRSLLNTTLLPWRLTTALLELAVAEHLQEELTVPERQALQHWKAYVEQHPGTPEAAVLVGEIEEAQRRWYETYRERAIRSGRRALENEDPARALLFFDRALRYAPENAEAVELMERAQAGVAERRVVWARSVGRPEAPSAPLAEEGELAVALLGSSPGAAEAIPLERVEAAARALAGVDPASLADEAEFALAVVERERGESRAMWDRLEDLAGRGDETSNLARHARALLLSPQENPHRTWRIARRADRTDRARWLFLGPLAHGARDRNLPRALEWVLEIPTLVPVVTGFGNRLVRMPFLGPGRRSPGVFALRYLEREPEGEHAGEVREWLREHEEDRGNYVRALRVAESAPEPDPDVVERLREKAAEQALETAWRERDLAGRIQLLRTVATQFEGTEAGRQAAWELRESLREATPQHIGISRGFLEENPDVAGPAGLALRRELLDGETANGELHPEGITLLGQRRIDVAYLPESGDPRDEPVRRREQLSKERMTRLVSALEEASLRMARTDSGYPVEYDADRDLYFERARLGLDEKAHPSPEARSSYAFRGVRERYGLVRARESILPVELVLQGSFESMSLGAFPRIRMPRATADAFLYE